MGVGDWELIFEDAPDELACELHEGEGELPAELSGTLLRNGPGIQRLGDRRLHVFDGQAFVGAATFGGGKASFRGRVLSTPAWEKERAAGRQLDRRVFTNLPSRWSNLFGLNLHNAYAHDVVAFGGRILATENAGWMALDPATLKREPTSPVDALTKPPSVVTPMARLDPATGHLVVYQVIPGLRGDTVVVHELDAAGGHTETGRHALPEAGLQLHDPAITANHLVIPTIGYLSVPSLAWGASPVIDAVQHKNGRVPLWVVPRREGKVHRVELPIGHHGFHVFNAWEEGGKLVAWMCLYDGRVDFRPGYPPGFPDAPPATPTGGPRIARVDVDLATGKPEWRIHEGVRGEAPDVDARRHGRPVRYGWAASPVGRGDEPADDIYLWFHGLVRVDFERSEHQTWSAGPRVICSPPAFAPRPGGSDELDGWVLCWLLNAAERRTEIAVFDAADLAKGPIARRVLPALLPAVSHVSWSTDLSVPV